MKDEPVRPTYDPERTDKVLRCVEEFIDQHGHPPSMRDVQKYAGLSSTSVADYHLRKLERMGLLERGACGCPGVVSVVADFATTEK